MRLLILSDMFSLETWLIDDQEPEIMPAVYEFFNFLGNSNEHHFTCFIFHKKIKKTIAFKNGSTIQIIPISISFHYIRKFFSMYRMYSVAKQQLKNQSFDVVYGLGVYSIIAALIGKRFKTLSVSRIFGSLVHNLLIKKDRLTLFTRYIFQYLELKHPADIIICTEDGTKFDQALEKINPKKNVNMLYNGIGNSLRQSLLNIPVSKKIDTDRLIRFYSIGRLTAWKRHDLVIKTIHHLKERYQLQIQLTILGHGEEKNSLTQLVKHLKLADCVSFKAPIAHRTIADFLSHQDIGLFLYDISNMGNAFWESCLSGRLLITRKNGKITDLFEDNQSLIVDSAEPEVIALHIYKLLNKDLQDDILSVRNTINDKIPSWENRFNAELVLIAEQLAEKI